MTANSFLKDFQRLIYSQPKMPSKIEHSENCENGDQIFYSKNLNTCFDAVYCTDSCFLYDCARCTNCVDCDYCVECELCYECNDAYKCFNCQYLDNCARLHDSAFCWGCDNCHDLFGCSNLKNGKAFCIFNRQLTEAEYKQKVAVLRKLPPEKILQILNDLMLHYPWTQTNESHNENSPYGNFIYYCKNCYLCFDSTNNQDCAYLYDSHQNNNCLNLDYTVHSQLSYEVVDSGTIFNSLYIIYSSHCNDSAYLYNCWNCKNCLGCVGLQNQEFCILNRRFSEEEYKKISPSILQEVKKSGFGWETISV